MLTITLTRLLDQVELEGPILVGSGKIISTDKQDLAVASGPNLYVYVPENDAYRQVAALHLEQPILSLTVGFKAFGQNIIILGTSDKIIAFGNVNGVISRLWQTEAESGANFTGLVLADLDEDKREELAAIASGTNSLFVYLLSGENITSLKPELLSIRELPGTPQSIVAFMPEPNKPTLLAIAYDKNNVSSIITLYLTESGFAEGPGLNNLPYHVLDLAAGNLLSDPGEELVTAGSDGLVRIYTANDQLHLGFTSSNLGTRVSALNAKPLKEGTRTLLIAGTPAGYVFGFYSGTGGSEPDWAFKAGGPIYDLDIVNEERVAVGTENGLMQVWEVKYPL